jgi:NTE family protein
MRSFVAKFLAARFFVVILLASAFGWACLAQENAPPQATPPAKPRARIGLALEGGGALGLSHIGVLKWFEEHRIPIDYVAGTSMGGLVGGFYAAGKSPDELKSLVENLDWNLVLRGTTPYQELSFRRKEDKRAIPNSLQIGLKQGAAIPPGLNTGHQITLIIERETLPYSNLASFDDLPIPFRCVATDLVSGKAVVFQEGSLAEAMRATMSLPGIFSPVEDQDGVYVDGGLVNNLPTDVVRQMGAEVVIAVHLDIAPASARQIHSAFSVLGRSIEVVIAENEIRGLADADLIVQTDVRDFTAIEYDRADQLIVRGLQAAERKARILENYSLDDAAWADYTNARNARKRPEPGAPQFIRVEGTGAVAQRNLEKFLQPLAGRPLDTKRLGDYLTRLTGTGVYDGAAYRISHENGKDGLLVQMHEKNYAPPLIQPAFQVDGSESDDVTYTLGGRLTLMDVAGYRSEWRTDFLFGNTYGVASELFKPFTAASNWFFAPHADVSNSSFKVYFKSDPRANYRLDRANIGADLGYGFNRFSEIRIGYEVGYLNADLRLGTLFFPSVSGRVGALQVRYFLDHTDDPVIPRRGTLLESTFRWLDTSPRATEAFPTMQLDAQYFQPITHSGSIFVTAAGGTTFGIRHTGIPQFFLGAPNRLSAYGTNELQGNQYYLFRAGYLRDLFTLPPFVGRKVYAVGAYEFGKMYGVTNSSKFPNDFAAGVIAETALGPVLIGASAGDSGHRKWFFQLGRVF